MNGTRGFTLVEVLIAGAIMLSALLGLLSWQMSSLQAISGAYWESVAITQAQNILEFLRANVSAAARARELAAWQKSINQSLPEGVGQYACSGQTCTATVQWVAYGKQSVTLQGIF